MSDLTNEIKLAMREFLQELVGPKVAAGATGFGPLPGGDRVYVQGGDGQESAWYRLDPLIKDKRHYILEPAFTGTVVAVNTRDASGTRGSTRKIDLTMRDAGGSSVTFVVGLRTKLESPETTVGSKNLLAGLASCSDNSREVTIVPRLGDTNTAVVLLDVFVDKVPVKSGSLSEHESAENLVLAMAKFGGTYIPLKDAQDPQPQPQRSAAPATSAKPVAAAAPAKGGADAKSQWMDMKFYLGEDDAAVAETRELIVAWCMERYGLHSPIKIPAGDQAAALHECKEYLDKHSTPAAVVPDEDWSDDVPF